MNRVSPAAWLDKLEEIEGLDASSKMARTSMISVATFILEERGCQDCADALLAAALSEVAA